MAEKRIYSEAERRAALAALVAHDGNISAAARQLNIPQQSLRDWRNSALAGHGPSTTNGTPVTSAVAEPEPERSLTVVNDTATAAVTEPTTAPALVREALATAGMEGDRTRLAVKAFVDTVRRLGLPRRPALQRLVPRRPQPADVADTRGHEDPTLVRKWLENAGPPEAPLLPIDLAVPALIHENGRRPDSVLWKRFKVSLPDWLGNELRTSALYVAAKSADAAEAYVRFAYHLADGQAAAARWGGVPELTIGVRELPD